MGSRSRRWIPVRDGVLPRLLVGALTDAGIPAVQALDLLGEMDARRASAEEVARGRILVAWDLEFADSERYRLKGHQGVLVVRVTEGVRWGPLVKRVVRLARKLRNQGFPPGLIVLDLTSPRPRRSPRKAT